MARGGQNRIDETGNRYGELTVVSIAPATGDRKTRWLCVCDCGAERTVWGTHLRKGHTVSCGCRKKRMTGALNPAWKGGRRKSRSGYIYVRNPGHPNADRSGELAEHTLVMSEVLGRPLRPGENVHHKNGVRDDNRPENLELWVTSQPAGQRPEDLIEWAKEIIERYGDYVS